ncbi:hypothetical protein NL676_037959 [Syzygium grande]|nr:hypothetical protein NL676_037959 [Syzygium grande]
MAANKFATMVHRNTNKMTLILIYAILEWTLISLLLLNSLFSYIIVRFADFFGLKRPCLLCSRLDHLFEPGKTKLHHRGLVCESHASEISRLVYCCNHQKLVELQDMCEDCSSSLQIGPTKNDDDEKVKCCCCCGAGVEKKSHFSPCASIKSCSDNLDDTQKGYFVTEAEDGEDGDFGSGSEFFVKEGTQGTEETARFVVVSEDCQVYGNVKVEPEEEDDKSSSPSSESGVKEMVENGDGKVELVAEKECEVIAEDDRNVFIVERHVSDETDQSMLQFGGGKGQAAAITELSSRHLEFVEVSEYCQAYGDVKVEPKEEENKRSSPSLESGIKEMVEKEDGKIELEIEKERRVTTEDDRNVFIVDRNFSYETDRSMLHLRRRKGQSKVGTELSSHHLEFYIGNNDCELIPVELKGLYTIREEDHENCEQQDVILDFCSSPGKQIEVVENKIKGNSVESESLMLEFETKELKKIDASEAAELDENVSNHKQEKESIQQVAVTQATRTFEVGSEEVLQGTAEVAGGFESSDFHPGAEEECNSQNDETDAEISIGTEIPDQETVDEIHTEESFHSFQCTQEDPSTRYDILSADFDHGFMQTDGNIEFPTVSLGASEQEDNGQLRSCMESNEIIEDEKMPDTPASIDSLHRRLLLLDSRDSGTEDSIESLDGSVISDIEGGEGTLTVEKLKSALRSERKALHALYAELEEERSASAVAASQTMAMINRLQEEKAAMQMEALQYQRMMEEQSEYDQEALQLLNDLMVKREKEKEQLEQELEIYRQKVEEYKAKEHMMIVRRHRTSSASCSNSEDGDGLSVDLNGEAKEEDGLYGDRDGRHEKTPSDAVVYLDESLEDFEEERLYILEQLKALEEKLFGISYEEGQRFEDMKPMIGHSYKENGNGHSDHLSNGEANGNGNGHSKMNGNHQEHRGLGGPKAKRLLPLFDAVGAETELDGELCGDRHRAEDKRLAIEEEVDHVYERLQALEADREFLKHCINSLRKGDKGLHLLQEILQHLRDLRTVEHRVRDMTDGIMQ